MKELDEGDEIITGDRTGLRVVVDEGHQRCDRGIELHTLDILGDLLDGLVGLRLEARILLLEGRDVGESGHTIQETLHATYTLLAPWRSGGVVTHEEHIGTKGIRTVEVHDVQRVDDIAL